MRKLLIIPLLFVLSGCAALGQALDPGGASILKGGTSLTATIQNPATPVTIFQVKSVYAAALDVANGYRDYCYPTNPFVSYENLMKDSVARTVCKRRGSVVLKLGAADDKAAVAIAKAEDFIARNPRLSAVTLIREAWAAVTNFKGVINTQAAAVAPVKQ